MGTIQIDGSTPKLTIGNATAEDATILFDGNAQDFYIALDDSADDLLIGKGSTVGTTPAIAIDENLKVNIPVYTQPNIKKPVLLIVILFAKIIKHPISLYNFIKEEIKSKRNSFYILKNIGLLL